MYVRVLALTLQLSKEKPAMKLCKIFATLLVLALSFTMVACDEKGPMEKAIEKAEKAADNVKDAAEDAADEVEDAADEVEDAVDG